MLEYPFEYSDQQPEQKLYFLKKSLEILCGKCNWWLLPNFQTGNTPTNTETIAKKISNKLKRFYRK